MKPNDIPFEKITIGSDGRHATPVTLPELVEAVRDIIKLRTPNL